MLGVSGSKQRLERSSHWGLSVLWLDQEGVLPSHPSRSYLVPDSLSSQPQLSIHAGPADQWNISPTVPLPCQGVNLGSSKLEETTDNWASRTRASALLVYMLTFRYSKTNLAVSVKPFLFWQLLQCHTTDAELSQIPITIPMCQTAMKSFGTSWSIYTSRNPRFRNTSCCSMNTGINHTPNIVLL